MYNGCEEKPAHKTERLLPVKKLTLFGEKAMYAQDVVAISVDIGRD